MRRFALLQRGSTMAVVALGFAALGLSGLLGPATSLGATAALLLSLWPGRPRLPARWWLAIQVGFLAWVAAQAVAGAPGLSLLSAVMIFVQVHRLLVRRGLQDDLYCYLIAFGQLLLASVLTISVGFGAVFALFLPLVAWALLATHLGLAVEERYRLRFGEGASPPPRAWVELDALVRWPALLGVSALSVLLLAGAALLFFVMPRVQAGVGLAGLGGSVHVSGFSERVRLGELGALQLSDEPVLRASLKTAGGEPFEGGDRLYWYGLALDYFDGRGWQQSDPARTSLVLRGSRAAPRPPSRPWTLRADVTLEPLDSAVLPHPALLVGLYGVDRMETVETAGYYAPGVEGRLHYTTWSDLSRPSPDVLRQQDPAAAAPLLRSVYTQLPPALSPRVAELAAEWTAGADSAYDAALLLQQRLRSFDYSLDQPASAYDDPLLAFLTDVREGHCEYFATAMAVLLRSRGYPARIVNGFAGGEWNEPGGYWLVRQRNAHSWVELWFPGSGWVTFDPTPGGAAAGGEARRGPVARLRTWIDFGSMRWRDVLLDYGLETQSAWVASTLRRMRRWDASSWLDGGSGVSEHQPAERGAQQGAPVWLGTALALVAAALALLVLVAWWRARRLEATARRLVGRWRAGAPVPLATALQAARWAADDDPERFGGAPGLVEHYQAVRFGGASPAPQLEVQLRGLARSAWWWRLSRRRRRRRASTESSPARRR